MKLWQKQNEPIDQLFERFTIGQDPVLDLHLAKYDVPASKAHVDMLASIDLLTQAEQQDLIEALDEIAAQIEKGAFVIEHGVEDCHSQIELLLTRMLGETGKKVHSGRSRNDQVLVALKLFTKDQIEEIAQKTATFFDLLLMKSEENKQHLMPGYTHMQVAMPSSFGLWFGAHAESLTDDLIMLKAAHQIADKNPLGSGAGYGSSFPLNREMTTAALGFADMNYNVIYAQATRGKMEKCTAYALSSLAATLAKFAMDVCLYSGQDFGLFSVDKKYTTGSSIMPHKHNPDGFELVRATCNQLQALPYELSLILTNLPTGYHRDLQVLKTHFIPAFQTLSDCLELLTAMTHGLQVNTDIINQKKYDMLFTVEDVNNRVLTGTPFRDAYREIADEVHQGQYIPQRQINHNHIGSIGNHANERIKETFYKELALIR